LCNQSPESFPVREGGLYFVLVSAKKSCDVSFVSFACVVAFAVSFFPSIVHFLPGNGFFLFLYFFCTTSLFASLYFMFSFIFFVLDDYVKFHEIGENVEMMKLLDIHVFWVAIPHPYTFVFPPLHHPLFIFTSVGWWTWISSMENYAKIWYTKLSRRRNHV